MPTSPTYLPVYTLPENINPTTDDSIVLQASGATGDVGLLPISSFIEHFADELIDSTTITAFTNDGWVTPI
jgi:hypothetical protein